MFDMAGDDTIQFGLGEPDFQPPQQAIDAFDKAMRDGKNKYTTTAGHPDLRAKIASLWHHLVPELDESNICITMSGTNGLLDIFLALVNPGDNVLIPEPYFPLYPPDVEICGGSPNLYPCRFENGFVPTIDDLEDRVNDSTVAILYNFPSNPTGGNVNPEQRDELVAFAMKHDLWIITDEVYDRIVYDAPHVSFIGAGYDKVIMVQSFSKTFAMTGWRIGYLLSPDKEAMAQLTKMQYYVTACSNDAMQHAVLEALEKAPEYPESMCKEFKERRDFVVDSLNNIKGINCLKPEGAFYVFPSCKKLLGKKTKLKTDKDFVEKLLEQSEVAVVQGSAFGLDGYFRISYATSMENLKKAMGRIKSFCENLS